MQFGIDVAQQRIEWDALVERTRFGEECGFTGAWGFDHFQPMYGEGPGNCFEGMTTLAALASRHLAHPARAARHRCDVPAPVAVHGAGDHDRPRVARTVRPLARCGLVRTEHRALGFDVPARRRTLRSARGRARDRHAADDRRNGVVRRARTCRSTTRRCGRVPVQQPHPPIWIGGERPEAGIADGREVGRRVALVRAARVLRGDVAAHRRSGRERGRDPVGHRPRVVTVAVGAVRRSAAHDRAVPEHRRRLPRLRVAERGSEARVAEFAQKVMPDFAG